MEAHPFSANKPPQRRIHLLYYLTIRGQLQHPHLIEASLHPSQQILQLKDFKRWLAIRRGPGIADSFTWSYKRMYRNGYVWQDVSDEDHIYPVCKNEYVLMGFEAAQNYALSCSIEEADLRLERLEMGAQKHEGGEGRGEAEPINYGLSSSRVYRAWMPVAVMNEGADASTQTGESKRSSIDQDAGSLYRNFRLSLNERPQIQLHQILSPSSSTSFASSTPHGNPKPASLASHEWKEHTGRIKRSRGSKHFAKSQNLRQIMSCGRVDVVESSCITRFKSFVIRSKPHQSYC